MSGVKYIKNQNVFIAACNIIHEYNINLSNRDLIIKAKITSFTDKRPEYDDNKIYYHFDDIDDKDLFINLGCTKAWRYEEEVFKTKNEAILYLQKKGFAEQMRLQQDIILAENKKQHIDKLLYEIIYN